MPPPETAARSWASTAAYPRTPNAIGSTSSPVACARTCAASDRRECRPAGHKVDRAAHCVAARTTIRRRGRGGPRGLRPCGRESRHRGWHARSWARLREFPDAKVRGPERGVRPFVVDAAELLYEARDASHLALV